MFFSQNPESFWWIFACIYAIVVTLSGVIISFILCSRGEREPKIKGKKDKKRT